MLTPSNLNSK